MLTDLRFAWRTLRQAPGYVAVAVLCLALGMGVNVAAFTMVNALLVRPLPFAAPDRMVMVHAARPSHSVDERHLGYADLLDVRARTRTLETVGGMYGRTFNLAGEHEAERVEGQAVTHEVLPMLGVRPMLGRLFGAHDDRPGAEPVVILSHGLWQRRFDARPDVVGEKVLLNGRPHTVVGVMPSGFRFPFVQDLWVPVAGDPTESRADRYVWTVGRLRPGATQAQAREEMQAIGRQLAAEHPDTHTGWTLTAKPLAEEFVEAPLRRMTVLMLGAVSLVLLVACANVANLFLARALARSRELAVRVALGASRGRIVRQLLTEGLLLALAGGALGVLLAAAWNERLLASIPEEIPYWVRIEIDPTVVAYTVLVSGLAALALGALPALRAAGADPQGTLREGGRGASGGRAGARARSMLVTAQVSLAVVLLAGAALLVRSAVAIARAEVGTDDAHILTLRTYLAGERYARVPAGAAYFERLAERVRALPGVRAAAVTSALPTDDGGLAASIVPEGGSTAPGDELMGIAVSSTPGLYDALGAPLLSGRDFTPQEAADTLAAVVIVNRGLAARLWPGESALGRRVRVQVAGGTAEWLTVVGVAPDLKYEEFGEESPQAGLQVHLPYARMARRGMVLVVRTAGDPALLADAARRAVRETDPTLPAFDVRTMAEVRRVTTWQWRMWSNTFGTFGALAVTLAGLGVYGVMAYTVAQRRREIGVRLALGATAQQVLRQVASQGARLAVPGGALGLAAALALARLLAGLLWGVSPRDAATFVLVPLVMVGVALVASWLPARRAARTDPATVMRAD